MNQLRRHPQVLEVNARLWLARLSAREGGTVSLSTVSSYELEAIAERFDALWLMGAWQRSPGARELALSTPGNRDAYDAALPGWTATDVEGSPYAIHRYQVDSGLGEPGDLQALRRRLHDVGVRLIVDFVPNHLAIDHAWTVERPELFVRGTEPLSRSRPGEFFSTPRGDWLAHGRDPNFPPWSDTAQVNLRSPEARTALLTELRSIAGAADGVRCDMAMLGLSDVFEQVWGWALPAGHDQRRELWSELIEGVREHHPGFLFVAEAYWGLEERLLELGFDYAYDKRLYDLLRNGTAVGIRAHLASSEPRLHRAVHFIENHDELRAPAAFGRERSQAAAITALTLPGLRLVHDGQIEGKRVRHPVQLVREQREPVDEPMVQFYDRLLDVTHAQALHEGTWTLLEVAPSATWDESHRHIVAWSWAYGAERCVVALNQSDGPVSGQVRQPAGIDWPATGWRDPIEPSRPLRATRSETGLDVHLAPWAAVCVTADR